MRSNASRALTELTLKVQQRDITIKLRHNNRAKRLILRLDPLSGQAIVTVPPKVSEHKVRSFLESNIGWIEAKQSELPQPLILQDGNQVPVRGIDHVIVHVGHQRGTVRLLEEHEKRSLLVSGEEHHIQRRVIDWLKKEARSDLQQAVEHHAAYLNVKPAAIRIKDTKSRWGSCSSSRVLSFSWRVIMAPPFVLDYLAAHEVAHLREMNHSDRFWSLVKETCPDFEKGKAWLRLNGKHLHAYGAKG